MADLSTKLLAKRHRAESRFRWYGRAALSGAVLSLFMLLAVLFSQGAGGFQRSEVRLDFHFDLQVLEIEPGDPIEEIPVSRVYRIAQNALQERFPEVESRRDKRELFSLISPAAGVMLRDLLVSDPSLLGQRAKIWVPATDNFKRILEHGAVGSPEQNPAHQWVGELDRAGDARIVFNTTFFMNADSRNPEQAGFMGAVVGSLLTLTVCLLVAFPLGVMSAVYLEEFDKGGRLSDLIEVNINNLAAVPSIVFGLLGLAVYLNFMGLPRSAPVVGGLTLAMMILPVIIISTRAALRSVPDSLRNAALALGASPVQVVWHHTLPLALPGIMTGTILGTARALGETAPLLMIGMVAFVADVPGGFKDPATAMPVQIYLWASSPEAGFAEKTAAGILVLLAVLLALNALAIYIRKRFEVRW